MEVIDAGQSCDTLRGLHVQSCHQLIVSVTLISALTCVTGQFSVLKAVGPVTS